MLSDRNRPWILAELSLQRAAILSASHLTVEYKLNKYSPDIGSRRCGGPSCCLTSDPVDVSCSLVQGKMSIGLLPEGVCCSSRCVTGPNERSSYGYSHHVHHRDACSVCRRPICVEEKPVSTYSVRLPSGAVAVEQGGPSRLMACKCRDGNLVQSSLVCHQEKGVVTL